MAHEPDDIRIQQLITRIRQQGDVAAYRDLVDACKSVAFLHAMRILKNREDAEEAVQDAFVRAFRSLGQFKGESRFSTWLYRIVYNTSLTQLRKKKMELLSLDNDETDEPLAGTENGREWAALQQQERKKYFDLALHRLSPGDAFTLSLYYVSENTVDEIAQVVGCSPVAAKLRLHRARARLERELIRLLQHEVKDLLP